MQNTIPTSTLTSASTQNRLTEKDKADDAKDVAPDSTYSPHAAAALAAALLAACGGGGAGEPTTAAPSPGPIASAPPAPAPIPSPAPGAPAPTPGAPAPAPGAPTPAPAPAAPAPGPAPAPSPAPGSAPGFNNNPAATTDAQAARFLQQSQFASTPADIASVRATSFAGYLQQQFAKPVTQTGWDWLESRGYGVDATLDKYIYNGTIADCMVWRDLFSAPDAMRKRVALALSEYFVVSFTSMEIDWRGYAMTAYWDILNKHAFGNFRDLLQDITLCPAMGYFLNTRGNKKANTSGRLPDENYAREIMQLFTIGLYELNLDGSIKTDGAGKKRETYTSEDVSQLARVFTGYDFDRSLNPYGAGSGTALQFPGKDYKVWPREYARRAMTILESDHSPEEIKFLGTTITAGTASAPALKTALDALFNHPNVGPFFGRQMIQRLVTSNPSPAYVARVASAFKDNGAGGRGDMKALLTAIFLDDEARGAASLADPTFGKLREPMVRLTQWARSFGVTSTAKSWKIFDLSDVSYSLGQSPMHSPSVFNYFRPGYVPPGTVLAASGATAPEFQIVNETTVGSYINFIQYVIRDGLYTFDPDTAEITYVKGGRTDIKPDYTGLLALINNSTITDAEALRVAQSLVTQLNLTLTSGQLAASSVATMTKALQDAMLQGGKRITNANTVEMDKLRRDLVAAAILMIMASPDYLIQK